MTYIALPPEDTHPARTMIAAAAAYAGVVFVAGFALGVIRTLWLAPVLGPVGAVALEIPVMLAVSWVACGWMLRRFDPRHDTPARAGLGAMAFMMLIGAEAVVWTIGLDRPLAAFLPAYREPAAALGLMAQALFAAMPAIRRV